MTVRVTATIRDRDRGLKALLRMVGVRKLVEIGVLGPKARAPSKRRGNVSVGEVATFNEFGRYKRPVLGPYFDKNRQANLAFARELAKERVLGRLTVERSLQMFGARSVGGIQKMISAGVPPPNRPSTIARKKSSKPLIDSGQLRSSYTYRVK